ncbi:hypothetical protein [Paenibacillus gorillae]|uniref:hypothetical protein n=1 Tax=Paenibacillus gorillae TaxID=1243662 RepID=UPI0004B907B7|nr:hypothetical protein [Paenibacillus gorillae]
MLLFLIPFPHRLLDVHGAEPAKNHPELETLRFPYVKQGNDWAIAPSEARTLSQKSPKSINNESASLFSEGCFVNYPEYMRILAALQH